MKAAIKKNGDNKIIIRINRLKIFEECLCSGIERINVSASVNKYAIIKYTT